jgi:hypothetical protein
MFSSGGQPGNNLPNLSDNLSQLRKTSIVLRLSDLRKNHPVNFEMLWARGGVAEMKVRSGAFGHIPLLIRDFTKRVTEKKTQIYARA